MKKFKDSHEEMDYLFKKFGHLLSPENVVDFAKDKDTWLNKRFTWNDKKASHEYRLWQARKIISLELQVIEKNGKKSKVPMRLYISLKDDRKKDGGYRLITDVMEDPDLKQKLLSEAFLELNRTKIKYRYLIELEKIFIAIEETEKLVFKTVEIDDTVEIE